MLNCSVVSGTYVRNIQPIVKIRRTCVLLRFVLLFLAMPFVFAPRRTCAQGNYEIQVYPYETVEPGHTMVELHSNFTF